MPDSLPCAIRVPAPEDHRHGADRERNGDDEAGLEKRVCRLERLGETRDDGRQEEAERVEAVDDTEVDHPQSPHPQVGQRASQRPVEALGSLRVLRFHRVGQPGALLHGEPLGLRRPVREIEPGHEPREYCGQPLDEEHHAPAGQPEQAITELDDRSREWRPERGGNGDRQKEERRQANPLLPGEPERQVEQHARKEAGLGDTEHHPQAIEPARRGHKCHSRGDDAPRHHNSSHPAPCPEPMQCQVARNLEEEVADEEQPRGQTKHRLSQTEILAHGEFGEPDVGPVEVVDEVEKTHEGHKPSRDLTDYPLPQFFVLRRHSFAHVSPPSDGDLHHVSQTHRCWIWRKSLLNTSLCRPHAQNRSLRPGQMWLIDQGVTADPEMTRSVMPRRHHDLFGSPGQLSMPGQGLT